LSPTRKSKPARSGFDVRLDRQDETLARIEQQLPTYNERLTEIVSNMEAHIKADSIAFDALAKQLIEINHDVKSIIASRAFAAGAWKAVTIVGGILSAILTFVLLWFRGK
jgi:hypothetical protein